MSWMSVLTWGQPKLEEGPHVPGRLKRRDKLGWQDVLRTVANVEMDVRRLHAARIYDQGRPADGRLEMVLQIGPGSEVIVRQVTSDPALDPIKDEIAHVVSKAGFPTGGQPVIVTLDCTFSSTTDTGFAGDDFGTGRGRSSSFGDPF